MQAWLEHEEPIASTDDRAKRQRALIAISAAAFAGGLLAQWLHGPTALQMALFGATLAAGGPLTIQRAWRALRLGVLDINVLMRIAAGGAVVLDQWSEGAAVVFLFALAQALEAGTLERARTAV